MTDDERLKAWERKWLSTTRAQAAKVRADNKGNPRRLPPLPKEMNDPEYQIYFNEALLAGWSVIDAHVIARQCVRQRLADQFAGPEEPDPDPQAG